MSAYVRPAIHVPVFRDAEGRVIPYGRRWAGSPPEETYSVVSHPERYLPLHTVADALIGHLRATYDVELDEGPEVADDLLRPHPEVQRAVRVRPADAASAALTFVFTTFPGVIVHAGLLHDFAYPMCGCDACDSPWEYEVDQLERTVLAVVSGDYVESVTSQSEVGFRLVYPNGSTTGQTRAEDLPAGRLTAALPILRDLPDGWAPWPLRADPGSGS
jgi:hypothetical protein